MAPQGAEPENVRRRAATLSRNGGADFPLPLPKRCSACGKRKPEVDDGARWVICLGSRRSAYQAIAAVAGFSDAAGSGERGEALIEGCGADATMGPQLGKGHWGSGRGERCRDAFIQRGCRRRWVVIALDELQSESLPRFDERDLHRLQRRGGAVLDRESEGISFAAEIEVAVAPGVELGSTAQRLAGTNVAGTLLGMVDDEHGKGVAALQLAQIGKQRGDLAAGVLVDAVQAHEGIEDQKARLQSGNGLLQSEAISDKIEAQGRGGDDLDIEVAQVDAGGGGDAFEPPAHDRMGILCGIEEDAAGVGDRKASQARDAACHGDGQIERQEGLAALGLAADDADGVLRPQLRYEPTQLWGLFGQAPGRRNGQRSHRRLPAAAFCGGGCAYVSRNSFSSIWRASRSAAMLSSSPAMFMSARKLP